MVTHNQFGDSAKRAYNGLVNDLSDNSNTQINVALMASSYTPDRANQSVWADISADEIDPANNDQYSAYGKEITNKTLTQSSNVTEFDGDNVTWSSSSITAYYAVIFDETPSDDSDKTLLSVVDFEGEQTSSNGDFTIDWDTNGIFSVDAS